jgi:putative NADH-flavin reductase
MRILVFGANGGVGRCLVDQATANGHEVTAAVRNPAKVIGSHPLLRVAKCDVLDASAVNRVMAGHEVVFCALGEKSRNRTTLYSQGARNILAAMQSQHVDRIVFLSNFGILDESADDLIGKLMLFMAKRVIRHTLSDHRRALEEIRLSAREWVVVRPLALTDGPLSARYRTTVDGLPAKGRSVSRADVAHFMLGQATGDTYLNQVPAIAY